MKLTKNWLLLATFTEAKVLAGHHVKVAAVARHLRKSETRSRVTKKQH